MMKINNILSLATVALIGAGFATSCSDKDDYVVSPYGNVPPVYFTNQQPHSVSLGDADTEYTFNIFRTSKDAASTVSFSWTGDTELFTLPSSASFEGDDLMTQASIEVVPQDLDPSKSYTITVSIPDTETTPYTQSSITFTFAYFPMSDWELFGYDEELGRDGLGAYTFTQYYAGTEDPVQVLYRYSLLNEDLVEYQFNWLIDNDDPSLGWETFLTAESSDGGASILVPEQAFAVHSTYGTVYISSTELYNPDYVTGDSYFDEVTGTFYLDVIAYVDAGVFGYGYETCTMNGYLDTKDYSVSLSNMGLTVVDGENYQLINFGWTENVSLVEYVVVSTSDLMEDDELSDSLVEELATKISEGEVDATVAEDQGIYSMRFDASGSYTIVAVSYKTGNDGSFEMKDYATLTFDYKSSDPNEGWSSLGYVEYTDGYVGGIYGFEALTYYVELQVSDDDENYYRLVDPYGAAYPYNEPGDWNAKVHSYLYFDLTNPDCAYVDYSEQTMNWGNGVFTFYSYAGYLLNGGASYEDVIEQGVNGTFKNNKLTFPAGTLFFAMDGEGWYRTNYLYTEEGEEVLDSAGDPVDAFLIDFDTITENPVDAASTRTSTKGTRTLNSVGTALPKTTHLVRFKANKLSKGPRTPYRTTLKY